MDWTRGVLRLWVVALLYWWGVRALLTVPSRHDATRELDAQWLHKQTARQKRGTGKRRTASTALLVYLALTCGLLCALAWVMCGTVRG